MDGCGEREKGVGGRGGDDSEAMEKKNCRKLRRKQKRRWWRREGRELLCGKLLGVREQVKAGKSGSCY